jgi:hypothetical protein
MQNQLVCWSGTKRTSSHCNVTCTRHDIAEKINLALNKQ